MDLLLAAGLRADFHRNITVVERDALPSTPVRRRNVHDRTSTNPRFRYVQLS